MNVEDLDPVELAATLGQLDVGHPLLVAARLAVEIAEQRSASSVWDYVCGGRWHRHHPIGVSELQRRRYPPHGDRELWVRYGPEGPPVVEVVAA